MISTISDDLARAPRRLTAPNPTGASYDTM
jgi:hypothetical protein